MAALSDTDTVQIRKYPNRRYYDVTNSRHLGLPDIRCAVQDGHNVCVRDSTTDEDITNQVLGQIVVSMEVGKLVALPPRALHDLIRSSTPVWRETVRKLTLLARAIDGDNPFAPVRGDAQPAAVPPRVVSAGNVQIRNLPQQDDPFHPHIESVMRAEGA